MERSYVILVTDYLQFYLTFQLLRQSAIGFSILLKCDEFVLKYVSLANLSSAGRRLRIR